MTKEDAAWINRLRKYLISHDFKVILILALVVVAISFPIYYYRINYPVDSDFGLHMLFTRYMIRGEFNRIPEHNLAHPGLQLILSASYWLTIRKLPIGFMLAAWMSVAQIVTAVVLYYWLKSGDQDNRKRLRAFFAISLTMIAPITLMTFYDGFFYFGYITLVNFHNPTVILVRPLALLSFMLLTRSMEKQSSSKLILFHAGLVVLSALVKPSYLVCILPAFILLSVWQLLIHHKYVDMRMLILGLLIPAGFVLAAQWSITYFTGGDEGGISILPLEVESHFSGYLLPKFLLSIMFPLSVLVFNLHALRQNSSVKLAWLGFLFGIAQMYLLAENGNRLYDGNFRWGAQIMSFLLFSASVRWIMSALRGNAGNWKYSKLPVTMAYLAHLLAGITYYIRSFVLKTYF